MIYIGFYDIVPKEELTMNFLEMKKMADLVTSGNFSELADTLKYERTEDGIYFPDLDVTAPFTDDTIKAVLEKILPDKVKELAQSDQAEALKNLYEEHKDEIDKEAIKEFLESKGSELLGKFM